MTHNVTNKNMAELPFINNNTFAGYLHTRGAVQHFCLDLLGSMHLYQLPRWYGTALPNWALTFLILGFLRYPQPFLIPSPQGPTVLTSHLSHTPIWVSADNTLIEPWHFLSSLQLGPGFFLIGCHCYLKQISLSSVLGIQSLEESQPLPHKSLKKGFLMWTYKG